MSLLLCLALTALGLLGSAVAARRRRARAATRWLAGALLPVGAYLTGLLTLGTRIVDAVVRWAAALTLNPVTWVGVALLAVAAVLFVAAAVAPRPARAAFPGRPGRLSTRTAAAATDPADEFAEIEEILRRRGL